MAKAGERIKKEEPSAKLPPTNDDDENDDAPIPGDLRNVLKRKLESKDDNSSGNTDLRLTLNARKSQRTSTGGPDPKGHPTRLSGDLRDKLNASVCDLRVLLNSSKPTYLQPRQHAPHDKNSRKDGYMYIVNENNVPNSTMVVRGEGWNKWERELDSSGEPTDTVCATQPAVAASSMAVPSRTVDLSKHCKYHDVKGHDMTKCKSLDAHYLSSLASGDFKFEPLKAKPKNGKSWRKNKERRAQRKATGKGRQKETQQRNEEKAPKDDVEDDSSADEEQPTNRMRIEVILSQQTLSSDDENDDAPIPGDLRNVLKQKLESKDDISFGNTDLRLTLNARKSQRTSTGGPDPKGHPTRLSGDLRDKLNASVCDLRVLLNSSKPTYLRGEPTPTPEAAPPIPADFMSSVMARFARQDEAPKDDSEDDSSADEEQTANRRRIEVILSQQNLSSDDENDDEPKPGDLRDVLKRKLESKDDNSFKNTDLWLTLDARKSQRTSTGGPDPKEHLTRLSGDLRDKLNTSVCDLRVLLNHLKPTDLHRWLEQTKTPGNPTLS
ncbi:hypothetical protein F2Q69_00030471 [Brassica cretica]|uniref:Uncharacterized protein n=1 Tax=Brassica cretica TaxID=69181 RepID=A0A8S9SCU7_BRACR|nr:hypothetical protein F2Q69_00030471 [Brassica cretica]